MRGVVCEAGTAGVGGGRGELNKINRKLIEQELEKLRGQRGVGTAEQLTALAAMSLQVQLEILDALDDILQAVSGVPVDRESN